MRSPISCYGLVRGARWSLFVLVLASGAAHAAIPASERQALLDLYTSTNGAGWGLSTNWNGAAGTECTWLGVTCDGAQTTVLETTLNFNNLVGPLPATMGNLVGLQTLDLAFNQLSGTIPSFATNTALVDLSLNSNQLIGSVDPSLGTLTNLTAGSGLDLRWNALFSTDATLVAFLNSKQTGGDWQGTQTIPVIGLSVSGITGSQATVNWTPIAYSADSGSYQVFTGTASGGPYTPFATVTANKSATSLTVAGLAPLTPYYFVVQSTTAPHALNQNTVLSGFSAEVSSATTPVELTSFEVE